jgi:hypothetical protein
MGSAASTSAGAAQQQQAQEAVPASPKKFLTFSEQKEQSHAERAWGENDNPQTKKAAQGTQLFKTALSTDEEDVQEGDLDEEKFEVVRNQSPKRPLDTMAASPKRMAER